MTHHGVGNQTARVGKGHGDNVLRRETPQSNGALPDSKLVMATGILKAGCRPRPAVGGEWAEGREA